MRCPIIPLSEAPMPRLQMRWIVKDDRTRVCYYELIIPLTEHDIRREDRNGKKIRNSMKLKIGATTSTGSGQPKIGDFIDTPFRDGAHAKWDSDALQLPVYAVFDGMAQLQGPRSPKPTNNREEG